MKWGAKRNKHLFFSVVALAASAYSQVEHVVFENLKVYSSRVA